MIENPSETLWYRWVSDTDDRLNGLKVLIAHTILLIGVDVGCVGGRANQVLCLPQILNRLSEQHKKLLNWLFSQNPDFREWFRFAHRVLVALLSSLPELQSFAKWRNQWHAPTSWSDHAVLWRCDSEVLVSLVSLVFGFLSSYFTASWQIAWLAWLWT